VVLTQGKRVLTAGVRAALMVLRVTRLGVGGCAALRVKRGPKKREEALL